jgi:hypothetical protein
MIPFMLTENSLTVQFADGPKTISSANPHFGGLVEAIRKNANADELRELFSLATAVKKFSEGKITIEGDVVRFNGVEIKNSVSDRILRFMEQGLPWQPLAKFLENLMANPSRRAVEYLYNFLEYSNLAITSDGNIDISELLQYVGRASKHEDMVQQLKWVAGAAFVLVLVMSLAVFGVSWGVVVLTRELSSAVRQQTPQTKAQTQCTCTLLNNNQHPLNAGTTLAAVVWCLRGSCRQGQRPDAAHCCCNPAG